jgi:hypothetical protein
MNEIHMKILKKKIPHISTILELKELACPPKVVPSVKLVVV